MSGLVVPRVGRVASTSDPAMPWVVLDGAGALVGPVAEFLRDLRACGNSAASCRSYGFDLRWFRFLAAVDVLWSRAERAEVRDFVCGCGSATTRLETVTGTTRRRRGR